MLRKSPWVLFGLASAALVVLAGSLMLPSQHSQAASKTSRAKQAPDMSAMSVNAPVIEGSIHPELVTDNAAYRLFFLFVAPSSTDSEVEKARQHDVLSQHAKLNEIEIVYAQQILSDFRRQYEALVATYNAAAIKALNTNTPTDTAALKVFLISRNQLVDDTRIRLSSGISPSGINTLDAHVQREKSRMRVAVE